MDTIQTNDHKQENYILKSNLWKLFKTLRAQANPVFSLLAASPIHSAWIVMYKKDNHGDFQRITVSEFVDNLKNIPNVNTLFKLGIRLYYPANQRISCGGGYNGYHEFEAQYRHELSSETVIGLFPNMVACLCKEASKSGDEFALTPDVVRQYRFKPHYMDDIAVIVSQCNEAIRKEETFLN